MKIAVIGAGTAGLAASAFLNRGGHDVTIYEKFESPRSLGAGLMLQPTGLAVLARLGLDKAAINSSSPIYGIQGHVAKTGKTIFDISYTDLAPNIFGLGIHRNNLFSLLYDEVLRRKIPLVTSACIDNIEYDYENKPTISDGNTNYGSFDLVINAQGARSLLRKNFSYVKKDTQYRYAALWGVGKDIDGKFKNHLYQRYYKAQHMIGVMPMGKLNDEPHESVAFFWSLRAHEYDKWRESKFDAWQEYVVSLWSETEPLIRQFKTVNDLNFATYGDVSLSKCYSNRLVFIGDAAHATSPQLGQGANLALLDALILSECLNEEKDVNTALQKYAKKRKSHVRFYQSASRWLTPFFQSDSAILPYIRDASFGMMCKTPFIRKQMLKTLAGVKTGLFTNMNLGNINDNYTYELQN